MQSCDSENEEAAAVEAAGMGGVEVLQYSVVTIG